MKADRYNGSMTGHLTMDSKHRLNFLGHDKIASFATPYNGGLSKPVVWNAFSLYQQSLVRFIGDKIILPISHANYTLSPKLADDLQVSALNPPCNRAPNVMVIARVTSITVDTSIVRKICPSDYKHPVHNTDEGIM